MDTQELPVIPETIDPVAQLEGEQVPLEERVARLIDRLVLVPSWIKATVALSLAAGIVLFGFRLPWLQASESIDARIPQATTAVITSSTTTDPEFISVHVAGEVNGPGVVQMEPGDRVIDALKQVGGITDDADTASLNLAAPLVDGTQVFVPARRPVTTLQRESSATANQQSVDTEVSVNPAVTTNPIYSPTGQASLEGSTAFQPVNPNLATLAQLQTLNGIGPALAQAIVDERQVNEFSTPDDLLRVSGIGEAKLEKFREDLVFN